MSISDRMSGKSLWIAFMSCAMLASPLWAQTSAKHVVTDGVMCGVDILARDGFKQLAGRKVGLITNHTGLNRFGESSLELIHAAPNVELVALFSPEHGLKGKLDERVADSTDPLTGLKVFSLYGKTRRPTPETLKGVDTLVFDIQDIGTRFYTYISTMGMAMEAAAEAGIQFVVLDRPNPITATRVFGPFANVEGKFTAYHNIPLVHGMTIGELAMMFNAERKINTDLVVIKMQSYKRSMWYDETLLTWVDPSPNMRSLTQATLYPAIGMIEACNVSVGRGTDTPFERFGAPWIKERPLAARLNGLGLKGVRFLPYRFTPDASKFKDEECGGVQIVLTDRNAFDPSEAGLAIVRELHALFDDSFEVDKVNRLLFNKDIVNSAKTSTGPTTYTKLWKSKLDEFKKRRSKYLAYD
ncbi:MAG: hypothetical protein DHS20C16_15130 [Phycisphaerae bacterium]|nr:MAG: hypothetical protein DHS20C16_15130 [Phycisphaerae bacterium]